MTASNSGAAGGGSGAAPPPPPTTRLMPYQHSLGLLSTLRIFRGENDDVKRVHVPLRLVVVYWELLCGLKKSTALLTLQALENDGSLSLTRYDAQGNPEYWEGSEAVEDLAAVLLEHGGIHSVIPRLVRVESEDSSSGSDEDDGGVDDDAMLLMAGSALGSGNASFSGGAAGGGVSLERPTMRLVNTASAELRKAKEEMEQLMSAVGSASNNPTEIFMLPREAAAMALHEGESAGVGGVGAPLCISVPNIVATAGTVSPTEESPKPDKDLRSTAATAPGVGPQTTDGHHPEESVAQHLTARVDALELEGVFIVLNQRQYSAAVAAHVNSGSVKSRVDFGFDASDGATGPAASAVASSPLRGLSSSPLSQRQNHVIFLSACDDEKLHETTVRAYRTMLRGREDNWAQGPQDHYYYQNVEYHVRRGAYQGPFELTLAWRLALLMNMQPEAFEPVYGSATTHGGDAGEDGALPTGEWHARDAGPGSPIDADWRWSHGCPPAASFADDDNNAASDATKPRSGAVAVTAAGAPALAGLSPSQPSPFVSSVSPPAADDLIPFFMKRCPLVAMAASRAERSLLNANKRAAGTSYHHHHGLSADHGARTSSLSTSNAGLRKSKLSLSPASSPPEGGVATPAHSPFRLHLDDGGAASQQRLSALPLAIPKIGVNSPAIGVGNLVHAGTPGASMLLGVTSPALAMSGTFGSAQGGGTRFGAEPFQVMLDAALSAMPNFDAVVELMLRGEERVSAVATFVLEHCIDMTEGQAAVVKALCHCFRHLPDERVATTTSEQSGCASSVAAGAAPPPPLVLRRGISFLLATSALSSEVAMERDPQAHVRCQELVHAAVAYMDYVDHTLLWADGSSGDVDMTRRQHETMCSELRALLLREHQLFFPGPLAASVLLDVVRTHRVIASQSGVLAYVGWLRKLHSIARCFRGSPLQRRECPPPSFSALEQTAAKQPSLAEYQRVASSVASPTLALLYEWSVTATSPALRWASSFMLHNRSPEEERSSFIEDVVYHYWVRHDTQEVRNGVLVLPSFDVDVAADLVQVMADFVTSLSSCETTEDSQLAMPWTSSEWRVLPPRLQKAIGIRQFDDISLGPAV